MTALNTMIFVMMTMLNSLRLPCLRCGSNCGSYHDEYDDVDTDEDNDEFSKAAMEAEIAYVSVLLVVLSMMILKVMILMVTCPRLY